MPLYFADKIYILYIFKKWSTNLEEHCLVLRTKYYVITYTRTIAFCDAHKTNP